MVNYEQNVLSIFITKYATYFFIIFAISTDIIQDLMMNIMSIHNEIMVIIIFKEI